MPLRYRTFPPRRTITFVIPCFPFVILFKPLFSPAACCARVCELARKRKVSRSSLVREALAAYTVAGRASVTAAVDAITRGVNGPRDLSSNPKHMARYGK